MAEIIAVSAALPTLSAINATFAAQEDAGASAAAAAAAAASSSSGSASAAAAGPPASMSSEDYLFVETRHPGTVLQGLNSLRLNNAFCDVTLCCGGQEFPCHRIVLASFSSYFQVRRGRPPPYVSRDGTPVVQVSVNSLELCLCLSPLRPCFPRT